MFAKLLVTFLGHERSAEGVRSIQEKLDATLNMNPSDTVHELRKFLGIPYFYRPFLANAGRVLL